MDAEASADALPVVGALRTLSIFGADQRGAYREHFAQVAQVLGPDVTTSLVRFVTTWGEGGTTGLIVLTGNAGTGKTAAAEGWCRSVGGTLPDSDEPTEVAGGCLVIKDLSGLPTPEARAQALKRAVEYSAAGQSLVCANEGVFRDAIETLDNDELAAVLNLALRSGAATASTTTVINVNRQRPTSESLWDALLDYVTREELWEPGCRDCPGEGSLGCPMRANAAALRSDEVRAALRELMQFGSGEAVPTMREVLAIIAWAIVGNDSCESVKRDAVLRGPSGQTAENSYFHRAVGGGLRGEVAERSPLLMGMMDAGLGLNADLEVDEWLRDSSAAPPEVRRLSGAPGENATGEGRMRGSRGSSDRVTTGMGTMTFHFLGETLSTSEYPAEVDACLRSLVGQDGEVPRQALWRQRVYFEGGTSLGGLPEASRRLLSVRHISEFLGLAETVATDGDFILQLLEIVKGLNFLVCGFSSPSEGLIIPDQSCLFARDPGSFRPAKPSLVYGQVPVEQLELRSADQGFVEEVLDVDRLEVDLVAMGRDDLVLRVRPRLFEAIREAGLYQGPVGEGVAEMTDVRGFYGRVASELEAPTSLKVADPQSDPPSLQSLSLPRFS